MMKKMKTKIKIMSTEDNLSCKYDYKFFYSSKHNEIIK